MNATVPVTKGERTRSHIVSIAAGLFWRRSFHGVSVDLVADEASVNKATVYRYFADKNDLALAVAKHNAAVTIEVFFAEVFSEFTEPQSRLARIYSQIYCAHRAMHQEHGDLFGCPIVGLALELGMELPDVRAEAQRAFDQIEQHFTIIAADAIAQGRITGSPKSVGRTLTQLVHGANASSRLARDPGRILDAGRASLALIGFPDTFIETEDTT